MSEKRYTKTKKVTGILLASVLFATTIVGAGFGFAKSSTENSGLDTNYNDYVQIEADVNFNDKDSNIKDAANSISETLSFLGMQNSSVRTIGDSRIVINNPISSYTYHDLNIMNNNEDHFDLMSASSNSNYLEEIGTLLIPLFFDGTLDIRDAEGDAAFVNNDVNDYQFVGGVENGGTFGVESTEGTEETYLTNNSSRGLELDMSDYYVENFFEGAELKHKNGYPVIELQIAKEGNNGDGYINMFKELDAYIDSTESSDNPTTYVFWFNYQLTFDLVSLLDSEFDGDLYTYANSHSNLRPLYVTANNTSIMSSKYSDTVEITGSFSEREAQYFVNKINNSQSFTYSNVNFEVVINLQTKIMLFVMISLLLLLILVVIFTFVGYFGLLGMVASGVFVISTMVTTLILTSSGILITGLGLLSLGVVMVTTALLMLQVLRIYKNNNEDKFLSINKVANDKLHEMHGTLFLPLVVVVLLLYVAGLLLSTTLAISLYLVVIGATVSYILASVLLFPTLYVLDILLGWTRTEEESKWTFISGVNKEYTVNNEGKEVKDRSVVGIIIAAVMIVLSVITGGVLYATTGSAFNTNGYGQLSYSYVVEATESVAWLTLEEMSQLSEDPMNPYGYEFAQVHYESMEKYENEVEKAFEDNGIKVSSVETIRVDKVEINSDEEIELMGSFGYQVYSSDKLNSDNVKSINDSLNLIGGDEGIKLNEESSYSSYTHIKVSERMSWNGKESFKVIDYTNGFMFIRSIYALLAMILVIGLILLFVANWGVSIATMISSLMEMALIISPLVLFYIPISTLVIIPVILLFVVSLRNKVIIYKQANKQEIEKGKWENASKDNRWTTPIFAAVLLVFELLLFGTYGWLIVLPMVIFTIVAPFIIFFIEQFVFVNLASKFDKIRNSRKEAQLQKDINRAKNNDDGEIREEYIEGVNM